MKFIIILEKLAIEEETDGNMYSLGMDIGYAAVKTVLINESGEVIDSWYQLHKGQPSAVASQQLQDLTDKWGGEAICWGCVTGQGSKTLARHHGIAWINESTALAVGSRHLYPEIRSVMGIGGQSAVYMTHLEENDSAAMVVSMNAQCAAGTGAFLEEQVSRLGISLEEYSKYAAKAEKIPAIAGRCSVFAKTDIIHHQQEGVPVANILQGLAHALVKNYRANVVKKYPLKAPVLLTGGVAYHEAVVQALLKVFRLQEGELLVAPQCGNVTALGAALEGLKAGRPLVVQALAAALAVATSDNEPPSLDSRSATLLSPLAGFGDGDSLLKHEYLTPEKDTPLRGYLGIDIGSTSTNVVFMDEQQQIRSYQYLRTKGDPLEAVREGLSRVVIQLGEQLTVLGVGTTGSGRHLAGKYAGADEVMDEITAQATAAYAIDPLVDTIIEIGGQDSKFIRMTEGKLTDFEMNKICAAGTGSFIEEQAKKLGLSMESFSPLALMAKQPVDLGERCTVFIETNIATFLSQQEPMENIAAGLAYAVARNYLHKVVGKKQLGERIFLQGGVAHNQAVVNAFRSLLGEKAVFVPPFFSVTGAYGAAILTQARQNFGGHKTSPSLFRGFHLEPGEAFKSGLQREVRVARTAHEQRSMAQIVEAHYLSGYDPAPNPSKKTVGIPRVLFMHKLFPLFNTFFKELGFRVVLSERTHGETVAASQEYALEETCYPIKLINGHVAELMGQGIDYLFLPSLYTMAHPISTTRQNYGCVYMQCFPRLVAQTMELDKAGVRLLSPALSFEFGKRYMMKTLLGMGKSLGKNTLQAALALAKGMKAFKSFEKQLETLGAQALSSLAAEELAFVIITRTYGVSDPVLNMGIPEKLEKMGYRVLTLANLPVHDLATANEHPNLYWPFGQHILSGARLVKEHPRLVPIYLTNHGCGPDTVLLHYFREMMGQHPFLHLEVDEHFSDVGILTRLEAFVGSLKSHFSAPVGTQLGEGQSAERREDITASELLRRAQRNALPPVNIHHHLTPPVEARTWLMPHLYPYSNLWAAFLGHQGIAAEVLPMTSRQSLTLGRQHTLTKENITFAALAGDVLVGAQGKGERMLGFLLPTTQGAEVDGQYHRLIRQKLDEAGLKDIAIWAPFLEDLASNHQYGLAFFRLVVAGDLVNLAPEADRPILLQQLLSAVSAAGIEPRLLDKLTRQLASSKMGLWSTDPVLAATSSPKILALGEPGLLFNDQLNHHVLRTMETNAIEVMRAPLAEALWLLWYDQLNQAGSPNGGAVGKVIHQIESRFASKRVGKNSGEMLQQCADLLKTTKRILGPVAPFEEDLAALVWRADNLLGLYAGGFGRYRVAKMLGQHGGARGLVTLASLYENTGTIINIRLAEEALKRQLLPVLSLTLDADMTETEQAKIDNYVYALKEKYGQDGVNFKARYA